MVTVLPTGIDDTQNLQCAIDLGTALGPGATIQLAEGTFTTAQLVVNGLRGTIKGMGANATVIHNPATPISIDRPNCQNAGPGCFIDSLPSPVNRYPSLISVIGRNVLLADLKFEIVGTQTTGLWHTPWGFDAELLSNIIQLIGSKSVLVIERVSFTSGGVIYDSQHNAYAGQAVSAVNAWSFSRPWFVTNSLLRIANCHFDVPNGIDTYNLDESLVFITDNHFEIPGTAWFISDVRHSWLEATHNHVKSVGTGVTDILGWAGNIGTGIVGSNLLFADNFLSGKVGISFQPGAFHDVKCKAVNNNVEHVLDPYAFDVTTPCQVVEEEKRH
jgi:hypothetical protein